MTDDVTLGRPPKCGRCGACRNCRRAATERARWRAKSLDERRAIIARREDRTRAERIAKRNAKVQTDEVARRKQLARAALNNAIARGRMKRGCCEVCGEPDAHAHHEDYERPLEVRWRCTRHHFEEHMLPDDTNNQEGTQHV